MSAEETTIEVDVVEIDGVSVETQPDISPGKEHSQAHSKWVHWKGRVKGLDPRWRPLWFFLGFIAVILILFVGVFAAVIGIVYLILKSMITTVMSLITPSSGNLDKR